MRIEDDTARILWAFAFFAVGFAGTIGFIKGIVWVLSCL